MKISFGQGNASERTMMNAFGKATATIDEVVSHFADELGYDRQRVDAVVNGATANAGLVIDDSSTIVLTPKANDKG